jgi:hypothetical protein
MPGKNKQVYKAIAAPKARTRNLAVWLDQFGEKHTELAGPALIHQPLELARRAREPVQYKQQLHRHGKYWFAQLGHHVWHESMFEKHALMFLDFLGDVEFVTPQPCLLVFEDGSYHYPDYFVVHKDGTRALLDVHFHRLITDKTMQSFANTKRICDSVGWKYETFTDVDPVLLRNVKLLSQNRHPRWSPPPEAGAALLEAADGRLGDILAASTAAPTVTSSQVYHLLWNGQLTADLTKPLNDRTLIRKGRP